MKKPKNIQALSELFNVLSDQTRLKLLATLRSDGEQHVTALCRKLRAAQPTISHHLGLLRVHGLVRDRRDGKLVYYSVDPVRFNRACKAAGELLTPIGKRG